MVNKRLETLQKSQNSYDKVHKNSVPNLAGGKAFAMSEKEKVAQLLISNTLGNTFYKTGEKLSEEALDLLAKSVSDPTFLMKAAKNGRLNGYMRTTPLLALVYLSTVPTSELEFGYAKNALDIMRTPKDIMNVVDFARALGIRKGLGSHLRNTINRWLKHKLSEYHAIKYPSDLQTVIKLTKPAFSKWETEEDPRSVKSAQIVKYLRHQNGTQKIEGDLSDWLFNRDLHQIRWFVSLKSGDTNITTAIMKGKLPPEAVVGMGDITPVVWSYLATQMPVMALTKNLTQLYEKGLLKDPKVLAYIKDTLSEDRVIRSKMFPYRFYQAYLGLSQHGSTGEGYGYGYYNRSYFNNDVPMEVYNVLSKAIESSIANVPKLKGKTLIAIDTSGSMSSTVTEARQSLSKAYGNNKRNITPITYMDIAALFGLVLQKADVENITFWGFDTDVHRNFVNPMDAVLTNMGRVKAIMGGGTDLSIPVEIAISEKLHFDNFVFITDGEEWYRHQGWGGRHGFASELKEYKRLVNRNVKTVLVRIDPYDTNPADQDEPNVFQFFGWSDNVIPQVLNILSGKNETLVQDIEAIKL